MHQWRNIEEFMAINGIFIPPISRIDKSAKLVNIVRKIDDIR